MRDINLIAISHGNCPTVGARVCTSVCLCVCLVWRGVWCKKSYKNQIYKMLTLISFLIYEPAVRQANGRWA